MVINEKKPRDNVQSDAKRKILEALSEQDEVVLFLAYAYATNFVEIGEDVTKKWVTTAQQTEILQKAYNKGYKDCLEIMRQEEKDKYPLGRNDWQE